jgi:hypothetical protein
VIAAALRAELASVSAQSEALADRARQIRANLRRVEDEEIERTKRTEHEALRALSTDTGAAFQACASMITSHQGVRGWFVGAGMSGKLLACWDITEYRGARTATRVRGCCEVPLSIEMAVFRVFDLRVAR